MKKLLAVLLTIGILFTSVLAVNSFAAGSTESGIVATPSDPTVPAVPEKLLASEYSDMLWGDDREFSAEAFVTTADGTETRANLYVKGSNIKAELLGYSFKLNLLLTNDKCYLYFPKLPLFHFGLPSNIFYDPFEAYDWADFEFIEAYYEDGYQVEKYHCGNFTYTYYFDDGELHSIETHNKLNGEHQVTSNFSDEVKIKDIILPPTAIFNATFLFAFFGLSYLI